MGFVVSCNVVVTVNGFQLSMWKTGYLQGLSIPFACVGSGDPVRVLRLYTTNTLDVLLKHLLLRHMYNLPLPILLCYAQALHSETSYCYCDRVTLSACVRVTLSHCTVRYFIYCLCKH